MGVPGSRAASPRLARTVRALPTAPADLPRARAISPGVCGPGLAARCAAVSRRSSPWPSRPVGVVRGAGRAGGGRGGGGICGGHLAVPSFLANGYYRRLFRFPVFPGTPRRYLAFPHPSTIFRLESRRFAGVLRPESERECGKRPVKLNPAGPARSCVRTRRTGGSSASPAHLSPAGLAAARAGLTRGHVRPGQPRRARPRRGEVRGGAPRGRARGDAGGHRSRRQGTLRDRH